MHPSLLMTISEQDKEKLESGLLAYVIGSKTPQQYLDHDGVLSVDVMSVSRYSKPYWNYINIFAQFADMLPTSLAPSGSVWNSKLDKKNTGLMWTTKHLHLLMFTNHHLANFTSKVKSKANILQ